MIGCFAGFVVDSDKLFLAGGSFSLAIATILLLKNLNLSTKYKLGLIYSHLIFLFFPFVLTTTSMACGMACMPCASNIANLTALALPTTLLFSTIAGFFIIPGFYMLFSGKTEAENDHIVKFVKKCAEKMKLKMPKIYIVDNANPLAFSFKSFKSLIFLSAGLIDLLSKREMEAVLLHELGHIKRRASVLTMSLSLLRFFSPLSLIARFHHDSGEEELYADRFARRAQKTNRHVKSAKVKIDRFERSKNSF